MKLLKCLLFVCLFTRTISPGQLDGRQNNVVAQEPAVHRVRSLSPCKWLLSLLLLSSAHAIDPTRHFFCARVGSREHYSGFGGIMDQYTLCTHYSAPFTRTFYNELPHDTQKLCNNKVPYYLSEPTSQEIELLGIKYNPCNTHVAISCYSGVTFFEPREGATCSQ
jgi:hypothetical protein